MKFFATAAYTALRVKPALGQDGPRNWVDVVRGASATLCGDYPQPLLWRTAQHIRRGDLVFGSQPTVLLAALAWMRRDLVYLCWGFPRNDGRTLYGIKKWRLSRILQSASLILVNEISTRDEIAAVFGRRPVMLPYVVDTEYFCYAPPHTRENFLLVPGSNDRDEELVARIAESYRMPVYRVTQEARVREYYESKGSPKRVSVFVDIPFSDLRRMYQCCAAVLLPLRFDNHASGQTALLESLASGAPVVISDGRSASIVEGKPNVSIVRGRDPATWVQAADSLIELAQASPHSTKQASDEVALRHSPSQVQKVLEELLSRFCENSHNQLRRDSR